MHKLLQRQIRKTLGSPDEVPESVARLLELVDDAYERADDDRLLLERSLELTSKELMQANAELRSERRALEHQLHQAQKMEAVGRLAGGVAHDFNNLLTAIIGYADLLAARLQGRHELRTYLEQIQIASDRGADLVRQLLAFSRQQVLSPKVIRLNRVVAAIEGLLGRVIGEDVRFVTDLDPELGSVLADPNQIEQVILNLAVNSREAMPEGGRLTLRTRNFEADSRSAPGIGLEEGAYVVLDIEDNGVGIEPAELDRIFEPFFTTKDAGSGLGLAMVYGIVQQSGGQIRVESSPGEGTKVTIYLLSVAGRPETDPPPAKQGEPPAGNERILLVEDEAAVRDLLSQFLEALGYRVRSARNGRHGLKVFEQCKGEIDLLLTDVVMPMMGGLELADRLRAARPDLKILFVSGYSEQQKALSGQWEAGSDFGFLQKPFTTGELAHKLRDMLEPSGLIGHSSESGNPSADRPRHGFPRARE